MKRLLCMILALVMAVSLAGCGETAPADTAPDEEILRAISYGLITEEDWKNTDKTITHKELCELITRMVALRDEGLVSQWEEVATLALESDEIVHRDDAILALFEAAIVMGTDSEAVNGPYDDWQGKYFNGDDWWEGATHNYPLFPNWELPYMEQYDGNMDYNRFTHAAWYFESVYSTVSYLLPFPPTEEFTYDFSKEVSVDAAIRAVTRYAESISVILAPDPVYVDVADVGTYDKSIITDELLNAPSALPEVTQQMFPSSWKGAGLTKCKDGRHTYRNFEEVNVAFLAENGFNFMRLFYSFETMRYPDYPDDPALINENELKALDQLLAWCMEYGIHLQIAMGFYLDKDGNDKIVDSMDAIAETPEEWDTVRCYWEMLSKRYAGIPSKYLTFDLSNETQPPWDSDLSAAVDGVASVRDAIWAQDADRVLLYSYQGGPNLEWVEGIAKLGIAVGCHPYLPTYLCGGRQDPAEPKAAVYWPYPYFPQVLYPGEQLKVSGDIGGKSLLIEFWDYQHPFTAQFNDGTKKEYTLPIEYVDRYAEGYEPLCVDIPNGATSVSVCPTEFPMRFRMIAIDDVNTLTWLAPHDQGEGLHDGGADLQWNSENEWSSEKVVDAALVYEAKVKPMQQIAEKYDVGFIVNEFGVFAFESWDIDLVARYHDDMMDVLEEHGIPWCVCELYNNDKHLLVEFPGMSSAYANATLVDASPAGFTMQRQAVKELLDTFRKYTMN